MEKFENATILVVDDEPFLLSVLCARLADFGPRLLVAENGQKALEIMQSEPVDAVLTDIDMPVMNGLEFLSKVRELGFLTPVVILTGHGDQASMLAALRLGATDFLDKPFESKVVYEVMVKALRLGVAGRALEQKLSPAEPAPGQISVDEFRRYKEAVAANVPGVKIPRVKPGAKS